jgi:hypothetical protein
MHLPVRCEMFCASHRGWIDFYDGFGGLALNKTYRLIPLSIFVKQHLEGSKLSRSLSIHFWKGIFSWMMNHFVLNFI